MPGISVSIRCSMSIRALPSLISLSSFLHGGFTPATSALGLGSPLPHLHRDWPHRCHICTGTGLTVAETGSYTAARGRTPIAVLTTHARWSCDASFHMRLRCTPCIVPPCRSASLQCGEACYSCGAELGGSARASPQCEAHRRAKKGDPAARTAAQRTEREGKGRNQHGSE